MDTIKIKELINDASCVFITAPRDIDFDAFGSMLGMYYCVTTLGKKACLVIDDKEFSKEMKREIAEVVLVGGSTLIQKYKSSLKIRSTTWG